MSTKTVTRPGQWRRRTNAERAMAGSVADILGEAADALDAAQKRYDAALSLFKFYSSVSKPKLVIGEKWSIRIRRKPVEEIDPIWVILNDEQLRARGALKRRRTVEIVAKPIEPQAE